MASKKGITPVESILNYDYAVALEKIEKCKVQISENNKFQLEDPKNLIELSFSKDLTDLNVCEIPFSHLEAKLKKCISLIKFDFAPRNFGTDEPNLAEKYSLLRFSYLITSLQTMNHKNCQNWKNVVGYICNFVDHLLSSSEPLTEEFIIRKLHSQYKPTEKILFGLKYAREKMNIKPIKLEKDSEYENSKIKPQQVKKKEEPKIVRPTNEAMGYFSHCCECFCSCDVTEKIFGKPLIGLFSFVKEAGAIPEDDAVFNGIFKHLQSNLQVPSSISRINSEELVVVTKSPPRACTTIDPIQPNPTRSRFTYNSSNNNLKPRSQIKKSSKEHFSQVEKLRKEIKQKKNSKF